MPGRICILSIILETRYQNFITLAGSLNLSLNRDMAYQNKIVYILFFILTSAMAFCQNAMIIGHRGSSYSFPENTVEAAVRAWEEGADAVEIDVYPTADGRIVLLHDKSTLRTTGVDYPVVNTNSDVLTKLDAGKWKDPRFEGIRIPLLEEVLDVIPKYKKLVIEVKSGPEIIPMLKNILQEHPHRSQIIFICFGWEVIIKLHEAFPDLPCFWLSSRKNDVMNRWEDVIKAGLDGINLHYSIIDQNMVEQAHKDGLGILAWTVNDMEEVDRLIGIGIDGITTDRPGFIRSQWLQNMKFD